MIPGMASDRKLKLTPATQAALCALVEDGLSFRDACKAACISQRSFYAWRERGEAEAEGIYHDFAVALDNANVQFKLRIHKTILENRDKDAQSSKLALELLTRRFPGEYSEKRIIEHRGAVPTGNPLAQTDEELKAEISKLQRRLGYTDGDGEDGDGTT